MRTVVAAVIERSDRRLLIGQRRRNDTSPLKWEFPGGKVESGETPEQALKRELEEELGAAIEKWAPIERVVHQYAETPEELEIQEEWMKEVERRIADHDAGKTKSIPLEDVMRKLRAKYSSTSGAPRRRPTRAR